MQINEAYERIAHVLNNPDGAVLLGNLRVLNDAGAHFYSMRPWRFARRSTTTLTIPENSRWITLPLGCAQVLEIQGTASWGGVAIRVNPLQMASLRASELDGAGNVLYWTEVFATDGDNPLRRRLEVFPLASSTTANALVMFFRSEWEPVTGDVDSKVALPIPAFAEPLFGRVLECFARGMERPESGTVDEHLAGIGPMFQAVIEADSRSMHDFGPARNTAVQTANMRMGANRGDQLTWDLGSVRLPVL